MDRGRLAHYRIISRLGAGGMGEVYRARDEQLDRVVAVKVLPISKVNDSSALERFYREARAVAALDHPNIVHAYDIDQDEVHVAAEHGQNLDSLHGPGGLEHAVSRLGEDPKRETTDDTGIVHDERGADQRYAWSRWIGSHRDGAPVGRGCRFM